MAHSVWVPVSALDAPATQTRPRHSALIRITHWLTTFSFLALLLTGIEILISHPRFYWGEAGSVMTRPLFKIPIPASRATVPTGYHYVLPDQNGWSRYLHFEAAWVLVFVGLIYVIHGLLHGHFRRNVFPPRSDFSRQAFSRALSLRLKSQQASAYNVLQRLTYLVVIFFLFPLIIWTGLAMSPAFASAFPSSVAILGGQQSARTIHFFVTIALVLFLVIHIAMVSLTGFRSRMRAMIIGRP